MIVIDQALIEQVTGARIPWQRAFATLGLSNSEAADTLSFLDDRRFARQLLSNPNITGAIVSTDLVPTVAEERPELAIVGSEDARWDYYSLYNHVARTRHSRRDSVVSSRATVHPSAVISDTNVEIGDDCIIGPNVTILADVKIGRGCIVNPGTVIGGEGFEFKRTSRGMLPVVHDGIVLIEDDVRIGANCTVDKGFHHRDTIIGARTKIDNLVHVAHGAQIGSDCLLTAGVILAGSVTIGSGVWLSINTSISNGLRVGDKAFVSIGAVVTRDVPEAEQVTGNFAVPHQQFLRAFRETLRKSK